MMYSRAILLLMTLSAVILLWLGQPAPRLGAHPSGPDAIQAIPDADADRVLGQANFTTNAGGLSATQMIGPAGLAIDTNGRLWVADYENNRVVSWPSVRDFSTGAAADMVIGQTDLNSKIKQPTAVNLNAPESVVVAPDGRLWVADSYHHRLLRYSPPFSTGMSADRVIGQANFTSGSPNNGAGESSPAANTLFFPRGLAFDSQGRLYVADMLNNRVLRFAPPFANNMSANLVLGQTTFFTNTANLDDQGPKRNSLWSPAAVVLDANDHLYVADRDNNRVLGFNPPFTNGMNADGVIGKPDYTTAPAKYNECLDNPWSGGTLVLDAASLSEPLDLALNLVGDLIVSDICFHRVLIYENPVSNDLVADYVYGQPDFTSGLANRGGSVAANTLKNPLGLVVDSAASLYVADFANNRVLAFDVSAAPPTATPTASATSSTPTATATTEGVTPTATNTATATATPTATATATSDGSAPTATNTPTATLPPSGVGDTFEDDDTCAVARAIPIDGSTQEHTFHRQTDTDYLQFNATANTTYRVEVQVPNDAPTDVELELYTNCERAPDERWTASFSPSVRLDFTVPANGPIYLRLANYPDTLFGSQYRYQISVRPLNDSASNKALIIVAGRLRGGDRLQSNIHTVTGKVYDLYLKNGYTDDNIYYLSTDSGLPGFDERATKDSLRSAILDWAASRLQANGVLTLYMMDHGNPEIFYIDELNGQRVTPDELNGWLTQLEGKVSNLKSNIFIEACQSGSFIALPGSISKPGRVVVTSTTAQNDAKASRDGAYFSDQFLTQLHQGYNLAASFDQGAQVARQAYRFQQAWLDANGDGVPNAAEDVTIAAQRSFAYIGTLSVDWEPHIFSVQPPTAIVNASGTIRADVRDDVKVSQVWAVVYPPGYQPAADVQELQAETLPTFNLTPTGEQDIYAGVYPGFTQSGIYRIAVYAVDNEGLIAFPRTIEVGSNLYLPVVVR